MKWYQQTHLDNDITCNNQLPMADFRLAIFTQEFKYRFGWLNIGSLIFIMWNLCLKLFNIFLLYLD